MARSSSSAISLIDKGAGASRKKATGAPSSRLALFRRTRQDDMNMNLPVPSLLSRQIQGPQRNTDIRDALVQPKPFFDQSQWVRATIDRLLSRPGLKGCEYNASATAEQCCQLGHVLYKRRPTACRQRRIEAPCELEFANGLLRQKSDVADQNENARIVENARPMVNCQAGVVSTGACTCATSSWVRGVPAPQQSPRQRHP